MAMVTLPLLAPQEELVCDVVAESAVGWLTVYEAVLVQTPSVTVTLYVPAEIPTSLL